MSNRPEGLPPDDAADEAAPDQRETDIHPAIDPREAHPHEPPPVDVDVREGDAHHVDTPDVIELGEIEEPSDPGVTQAESETTDAGEPSLAADEELDRWPTPDGDFPGSPGSSKADAETEIEELASRSDQDIIPPPNAADDAAPFQHEEQQSQAEEQSGPGASDERPEGGAQQSSSTTDESRTTDEAKPRASRIFADAASRLGLGRLLETTEPEPKAESTGRAGTVHHEPTDPISQAGLASGVVRAKEGFRGFLDPGLQVPDILPHRRFALTALGVALLFLMANSAGLALITLALIAPVLILLTLVQHDVFEKESNMLIAAVAAGAGIAGIILGSLASWIQAERWFDRGKLNFGAGGFGGRFAEADGSPPFLVWFLVGLLLPALSIAAIAGIPIALRRWPQFRNEVMDGVILTGAAAAGFAIGANIVYWWPMLDEAGPQGDVSEWTLRVIGVTFLRSIVISLCGAMIGAGVWRYMMSQSTSRAVLPAIAGVLGIILMTLGSVQVQASDIWTEWIWTALLAIASFVLYRRALEDAVATDKLALGRNRERVVCPACHRVTPLGTFCAYCGHRLSEPAPEPASTAEADPGAANA